MKLYNIISILNNQYGPTAICPFNKNNIQLIKLLYNEGYIQNYIISYNYNKIYIEFNYYESIRIYNGIKLYYKMGNYFHVTYKQLKKLNKKNKKLLISTCYGLCLSEKAIKYKIGGKILGELK
jgi:ribosomal protein S8